MASLLELLKYIDIISPRNYEILGKEGYVEVGPETVREQKKTTINRVLITVYPSSKAIAKASQDKANLIITYYPMFNAPTRKIVGLDLVRLRLLVKNYISMYVIGSSWVAAKDGLTDALSDVLDLNVLREFTVKGAGENLIPIGRICRIDQDMNHSGFINYVSSKLGIESVSFTGVVDDEVGEVMLCAGDLLNGQLLSKCVQEEVKTIVTGHLFPEDKLKAHTFGLNIIELGQFITETPGMRRLKSVLSIEYPDLKIEFVETEPITQTLRTYQADMA